jgi:hypothetical protein
MLSGGEGIAPIEGDGSSTVRPHWLLLLSQWGKRPPTGSHRTRVDREGQECKTGHVKGDTSGTGRANEEGNEGEYGGRILYTCKNMDHPNLSKLFREGEWERGRIMEGLNQTGVQYSTHGSVTVKPSG